MDSDGISGWRGWFICLLVRDRSDEFDHWSSEELAMATDFHSTHDSIVTREDLSNLGNGPVTDLDGFIFDKDDVARFQLDSGAEPL